MSRRLLIFGGVLCLSIASVWAQGAVYTYDHPTSDRKSSIWIPDGVTTIRGILLNGNGANSDSTGEVNHLHKRAFCEKFDFALMATGYYHGFWEHNGHLDMEAMTNAIQAAATASGHPELVNAPFVTYGFSNGGQMAYGLMHWIPDRVIAFCANKGVAYRADGANPPLTVPGILIAGATDSAARRTSISNVYTIGRSEGAPWAWLEEHNVAHERGNAEALLFAFYAEVIEQRYPANLYPTAESQPTLLPVVETNGWLVSSSPADWATGFCEIQPSAGYVGDKNAHGWVPSEDIAHIFRAVASYDTSVSTGFNTVQKPILTRFPIDPIESWGGRGRLYYPGRTIHYEVDIAPSITDWTKIEFFDGATKLGQALNEGSNTIIADLLLDAERSNNSIHAVLTLSNATQRTSSVNMMQSDTLRTPDIPTNLDSNNADEGVPSASANHTFSWGLPTNVASVTGYSWAMNGGADEESQGTTPSVAFENLPNGEHVFRVRARANNVWGPSASFTLLVDATPTIEVSDTALDMVAVTSATFNVWMSGPSDLGSTVTVARTSGDAEFDVQSGATLVFTPANWTTPQTVTIVKNEPYDPDEGGAVFTLTAPGSEPVNVTVTGYDPPSSLLYYEGFDYTEGINLNGANGGTGWGGAWDKGGVGGAAGDIQEDGLAYSQGAVSLAVEGRSFRNANGGVNHRRELSDSYSSNDDTTLWFSFLAYGVSGSRVVIDFATDNNAYNRLGVGMLPSSANWQVGNQLYSAGTDTGIAFSTNAASPDLILGRIQLNAVGDDVLDVWINPSLSTPPAGAADAQRTGNWTFDRFRVHGASANHIGLDEIRIGETWSSVVGSSGGGAEPPPGGPTINTQSASVTIDEGESATLSVSATASEGSLTYQWHQGESGVMDPVENATNATFNTPVFNFAGTYSYWVAVSDDNGTTNSATATVTVLEEGALEPLTILWFGNSLSPNTLRDTINAAAQAAGYPQHTYHVQQVMGSDIQGHLDKIDEDGAGNIIDSLPAGSWDVVIIQGASLESSTMGGDTRDTFVTNSIALYNLVHDHSPGVRLIMYETWARPPHHFSVGSFPYVGGLTPEQAQEEMRQTHSAVAAYVESEHGAVGDVSYVGTAMQNFNNWEPSLFLASDGYHLSQNLGRLFTGMVLYNTIYNGAVEPLSTASASISALLNNLNHTAEEWVWMAQYADDPFFDRLRIDEHPQSAFVVQDTTAELSVSASTQNGDLLYQWYEGQSGDTSQPIANATNATYTTPVMSVLGEFDYWVEVSDGTDTRNSFTATLTVRILDVTPPDAIADLAVTSEAGTRITLAWTAPSDDVPDGWGTASYDIRYSTSPITAANFDAATPVANPPVPAAAGTPQTFDVLGLSTETTYYFAIKTIDEADNVSDISNVASGTTLAPAPSVLIDDFDAYSATNLPHSTGAIASTLAGWRSAPSLAGSGYGKIIETGGNADGHLRGHRTFRATARQGIGIWINRTDYPELMPGETYYLQFDYRVGREGELDYRDDAWMRYSVGARTNATYVEARAIDGGSGPNFSNASAIWTAAYFQAGPVVTNETAWSTYTSGVGFSFPEDTDLLFIAFASQGFGIQGTTSDWDTLSEYTHLDIDNVWFISGEPPVPGPKIAAQPTNVTINVGETAMLSVTATTETESMGYQWYQGARGDTSNPIGGAVGASYTTPIMNLAGSFDYWVRVFDDDGAVDSETATVTVIAPDTDGDGIPDWWEDLYFGGPTAADASAMAANQVNTLLEAYIADLDPSDAESFFVIETQSTSQTGYVLTWTAAAGRRYTVYGTSDLTDEFVLLVDDLAVGEFVDEVNAAEPQMFYRIEVKLE